jgi:hypothetical protein
MGAAEAVNSLTAAINTFNKAGLDSTVIINKLANVDAAFAVSSDDLAKALGRVGSSAQGAGVSLDQLLAIVTTVQQKTARGGAVIGNSFKTIFTRIQRPRVIKELENLGVAVRDVEGDMLPAIRVLSNLAKQFDNLSQSQRSQITELVGGVFQVNILKSAMSDLSKETGIYSRALDISLGSSDQALKRNEELNKTLSAQFQRTVNTFKEGAAELGELTLGPTLEKLFGAVEGFAKLGDTDGGKIGGAIAKSIFEGIGNFISGPGLMIIGFTLFKTFSQLGKFAADAFKTLTGLNKNFQNQLNLQKQIFSVLDENPDLLRKIKDGTISVEDAHKEIYDQISKNTTALEDQLIMSQRLAAGLAGSGAGYSSEFGAFAGSRGGKKPKFGASGYMPNFSEEIAGMIASGYSKSQVNNPKVKRQNIHDGRGGSFSATINGHEDVLTGKNSKGKMATFVVPPKNTDAYKEYMSSLSGGFFPNFAKMGLKGRFGVSSIKDIKLSKNNLQAIEDEVRAGTLRKDKVGIPQIDDAVNRGALVPSKSTSKKERDTTGKSFVNLKDRLGESGGGLRIFDVKKKFGLLGLYGRGSDKGYGEASVNKISEITKKIKAAGLQGKKGPATAKEVLGIDRIGFKNASFRALGGALEDDKQDGWFSKELRRKFAKPMENLANSFSKRLLGNDATSTTIGASGAPLMSTSAEGNVFETVVNALTSQGVGRSRAQAFEAALSADQNQTWDFEESGRPDGLFKKYFGFDKSILKADAKRSINSKAGASMANKIFNTSAGDMGQGSASWHSWVDSAISQAKKSQKSKAAGYIPNFNALYESVRREKEAGVPAGRIRVGQSEKLKNPSNPAGFGIYNTRDEPMGLSQGINNSIAAGVDPKKQGRFNGYIPNYAGASMDARNKRVPQEFPIVLYEGTKKEIVNTFTKAFKQGAKKIEGGDPLSRAKSINEAPTPESLKTDKWNKDFKAGMSDVSATGAGSSKKSGGSKVEKNTQAVQKNTMGAMKAMLIMGMVEQGASALNNSVSENNTVAKSLTSSIATLVTAAVALKYAMDQAKDSMGITDPRGTIEGTRQRRKLGEGIQDWGRKQQRLGSKMGRKSLGRGTGAFGRTPGMPGAGRKGFKGMMGRGFGAARGMAGRGAAAVGGKLAGGMASGGLAAAGGVALAGLAVGKIVGNLFSESDLDPTFKAAREAGQAFERIRESTERNIGALNNFATAAEQAAQVYGDGNATMTQVVNATKKVEKEMMKLPTEFRDKLAGIADPDMINNLVQQFTAQEQEKSAEAGQSKFAADTLRSSRNFGAAEWFNSPFSSTFNAIMPGVDAMGRTDEDIKLNDQNLDQTGKNILQTSLKNMGADGFRGADLNKVFQDVAALDVSDEQGRKDTLAKGLGLDPEKDAAKMKIIMDIFNEGGEPAEKFFKSLSKNALEMQASLKTQKAMEPARKAFLKANREAEKQIRKQKSALESEQRIRKEVIKITSQAAKSFLTSVGSIKLDQINKINDLQAESAKKFGSTVSEVQTAMSKTDGAMGSDLENSTKMMLNRASKGGVGSVTQQQADTQAEKIQQKIDELRASDDPIQKAQADKLEATKIAIENLGGTSERMKEELAQQTNEIKQQTKAQIAAARQAQRLKSFGGTEALLDPSKLNASYTQIRSGGQAMAMSAAAGSQTGFNRGRINQLKAMQDLAGGELSPEKRREARMRAEQVALSDARKQNAALGFGLSDKELRKGAAEKAANLFKGDPQEQNTKALESLTTALKEGVKLVSTEGEGRVEINKMQNKYSRARGRSAQRNLRRGQQLQRGYSGMAEVNAEGIAAMDKFAHEGVTEADRNNYMASMAAGGAMIGAGVGTVTGPGMLVTSAGGAGLGALGGYGKYKLEQMMGPTEEGIRGKYTEHMGRSQGKMNKFQEMIDGEGGGTTNNNNSTTINFPQGPNSEPTLQGNQPNANAVAAAGKTLTSMANRLRRLESAQQKSDPSIYNQTAP